MLTDTQQAIIQQSPTDIVVFAAPGSGKTTVLTKHIQHQLLSGRLQAGEIMAMTFTRQAAEEMKRRVRAHPHLQQLMCQQMRIGTFHAQWFRILLEEHANIPVMMSPLEQYTLMEAAVADVLWKHHVPPFVVQQYLNLAAQTQAGSMSSKLRKKDRAVLSRYHQLKTRRHRWDFDDILMHAYERVANSRSIPALRDVRYILIDEFQDTNAIQWAILQGIRNQSACPVFVVGDDDQSIYGFRGASPQWFLEFSKSASYEFKLTMNFRSDERIVASALRLIEHNQLRAAKQMSAASTVQGRIVATQTRDETMEAGLIQRIFEGIRERQPTWQLACLARTRKQLQWIWQLQRKSDSFVELRTCHDAKGKEWDVVWIAGAVEPNPHLAMQAKTAAEAEEERRLFYVAVTRARHLCLISSPRLADGTKVSPIRYINEAQLERWTPGQLWTLLHG